MNNNLKNLPTYLKKLNGNLSKVEVKSLSSKKIKNLAKQYNNYVSIFKSKELVKKLEDISKSNVERVVEYLSSYNSLCNKINNEQKLQILEAKASKSMATERIKLLYDKFCKKVKENKKIKIEDQESKLKKADSSINKFTNQLSKVEFKIEKLEKEKTKNSIDIEKFNNIPNVLAYISKALTNTQSFLNELNNRKKIERLFNLSEKKTKNYINLLNGNDNSVRILFNQIDDLYDAIDPKTNNIYDGLSNLFGEKVDAEDIPEKLTFYSVKEEEEKIDNFFTFLNKEAKRIARAILKKTKLLLPEEPPKTEADLKKLKNINKTEVQSLIDENRKIFNDTDSIKQEMETRGINKNFQKALTNLYKILLCKKICSTSIRAFSKIGTGGGNGTGAMIAAAVELCFWLVILPLLAVITLIIYLCILGPIGTAAVVVIGIVTLIFMFWPRSKTEKPGQSPKTIAKQ